MIDIHIHILPGVDDGPARLEQSAEMCRMAAVDGCEALIATPHQLRRWDNQDPGRLQAGLDSLQEAVGARPRLYLGAEVHVSGSLLELLERPDRDGLLSLAGSRYLLVEFPQESSKREVQEVVHELILLGLVPIVAHPEFIPVLEEDPGLVAALAARGALVQVTAMSVTGDFGRPKQRAVSRMLDDGSIHFVASDAHSPEWRPPGLARARETIAAGWGEDVAERLTRDNAREVLAGGC